MLAANVFRVNFFLGTRFYLIGVFAADFLLQLFFCERNLFLFHADLLFLFFSVSKIKLAQAVLEIRNVFLIVFLDGFLFAFAGCNVDGVFFIDDRFLTFFAWSCSRLALFEMEIEILDGNFQVAIFTMDGWRFWRDQIKMGPTPPKMFSTVLLPRSPQGFRGRSHPRCRGRGGEKAIFTIFGLHLAGSNMIGKIILFEHFGAMSAFTCEMKLLFVIFQKVFIVHFSAS